MKAAQHPCRQGQGWEQSLQAGLGRWRNLVCSYQERLLAQSVKRRSPARRMRTLPPSAPSWPSALSLPPAALSLPPAALSLPPAAVQPGQSLTLIRRMPEPAAASKFLLKPVCDGHTSGNITPGAVQLIRRSCKNGHRPYEGSGRDDSRPAAAGDCHKSGPGANLLQERARLQSWSGWRDEAAQELGSAIASWVTGWSAGALGP